MTVILADLAGINAGYNLKLRIGSVTRLIADQVILDLGFPLTRGASSTLDLKLLLSLLGQTKQI